MSRTINSKPTACTLLALLGALALALALSGCGNLGKFDEAAVTRQAEQYYAEKYGTSAQVVDVWEDRSYSLFAYYSLDRAFCTMDDGSTVLVDFEQGVLGDNRQQDEIAAAYEQRFREELAVGRKRLEDAGYTVSLVLISGSSPADDGFLADTISIQEWQRNDEAEPETGSFFLARYTGDDRFFEEEASRVSLGTPRIEIEVSGPDADYANAFPTNVPEKPAWADPVEETCRALLPLTDGKPTAEVFVYQSGYRDRAVADDAECGKLGELSPYGKTGDVGSWLIVDWVDLGKGVHITSNEPGVRLHAGDTVLEETDSPCTFDELQASGSLDRFESRSFSPAAFQAYRLTAAPGLFSSLPADVRSKGWFSIKIAYDNKDPDTGLQDPYASGELGPSLYMITKNSAAEDHEDEPPYSVIAMRKETLDNGFQYCTSELFADRQVLYIRM